MARNRYNDRERDGALETQGAILPRLRGGHSPAPIGGAVNYLHARVPEPLADAARQAPGVPAGLSISALVRLALARLARWPESAVETVARVPDGGRGAGA